MKFTLLPTDAPVELGQAEKAVIKEFLQTGQSVNWDAEAIHNRIHEILRSGNMDPKEGFSIFYRVLIGKTRGPRLGYICMSVIRCLKLTTSPGFSSLTLLSSYILFASAKAAEGSIQHPSHHTAFHMWNTAAGAAIQGNPMCERTRASFPGE